jgi:hypothetical protein
VTFQFYRGTYTPHVPLATAARALAGAEAVTVAVGDVEKLRGLLPAGTSCHILFAWPESGPPALALVSNR